MYDDIIGKAFGKVCKMSWVQDHVIKYLISLDKKA